MPGRAIRLGGMVAEGSIKRAADGVSVRFVVTDGARTIPVRFKGITPDLFKDRAFEDSALPIACGQTISQPYIVGLMSQALEVEPRSRVLEIGTGSGYQTTILSKLSRLVYTVERYRTLLGEAEARFKQLGLTNVITRFGDGGLGWPEQAPFDRILVTAAAPDEPKALLSQLKPKGVLVAPIGKGPVQSLKRYTGDGAGGFRIEVMTDVRFVPLLDGVAKEL